MPARGRWYVTVHAVLRMRQLCPHWSYETALGFLIHSSETAHYVREKGDAHLYRGESPHRLRFIVSRAEPGEMPCLLTVLPTYDGAAGRREIDDGRVRT